MPLNSLKRKCKNLSFIFLILVVCVSPTYGAELDHEPKDIVRGAVEYWRDSSSRAKSKMTVHRPDWEKTYQLEAWTKGMDYSLVRFTAPARDAGNATLTTEDDIWTFTPKTNRVVKIPQSMKTQNWMGSDFSYRDLSKDDEIIDSYNHKLRSVDTVDGMKVYTIESIPHEHAPVVYGKEVLRIREDHILLEHEFYDQDFVLLKVFRTRKIEPLGGKLFGTKVRMEKIGEAEEWTEIEHIDAEFGIDISKQFFSLSNLRNPRN